MVGKSDRSELLKLIEDIYATPKRIVGDVGWKRKQYAWFLEKDVKLDKHHEKVILTGEYRHEDQEMYLALNLRGVQPIRKLHFHDNHRNKKWCSKCPDKVMSGIHKHYPSVDDMEARCAYVPDDITSADPHDMVEQFLKECNIKLEGSYHKNFLI